MASRKNVADKKTPAKGFTKVLGRPGKGPQKKTAAAPAAITGGGLSAAAAAAPALGMAAAGPAAAVSPIDAVHTARQAALITAQRISEELPHVLDPMDRMELRSDRDRANTQAEDLRLIEIDLTAGLIVIGALNPADVTELVALAGKLDASIVRGRLVNLTLDSVNQVLESVARIKDIVR